MAAFAAFDRLVQGLAPKAAIVLGSGLSGVIDGFQESGLVDFADIPGLFSATVSGHKGQLAIGLWDDVPLLLFRGRLHIYEGFSLEVVTAPVKVAAGYGIKNFIMTNASGGIALALKPGSLMAIRQHIKLVGNGAWNEIVENGEATASSPYSTRMIDVMRSREAMAGRELLTGVYAAITGPSYETPAEIRALAACGADIVGMSTALEAEFAASLGLEVAAISCVTNAAAGLSAEQLNHADVLVNAKLGVARMGIILGHLVRETR
jgi:purine-nucleoside phosphorylase